MLHSQEPGRWGSTSVIPRERATMLALQMHQSSAGVHPCTMASERGRGAPVLTGHRQLGARGGAIWKHEAGPSPLKAWLRKRSTFH